MDLVIVGELSYQDPLVPVVLSLVDKEPEELFNLLVDTLGLAISLQVIGCRCGNLDSEYLTESAHELGDELHSPVTDFLPPVVLGKFGLVWFEPLFAKPETGQFGFWQNFHSLYRFGFG